MEEEVIVQRQRGERDGGGGVFIDDGCCPPGTLAPRPASIRFSSPHTLPPPFGAAPPTPHQPLSLDFPPTKTRRLHIRSSGISPPSPVSSRHLLLEAYIKLTVLAIRVSALMGATTTTTMAVDVPEILGLFLPLFMPLLPSTYRPLPACRLIIDRTSSATRP